MANKPHLRARLVTTAEGTFVNVQDFQRALMDDEFILECAAMIKIGKQENLGPVMAVRLAIANALNEVAGINDAMQRKKVIKLVIEDDGKAGDGRGASGVGS